MPAGISISFVIVMCLLVVIILEQFNGKHNC